MAHGKKRHEEHEEHENHERWLVTYADMITLLMAFFIMLFAMSQLDLEKFKKFQEGAAGALGGEPSPLGGGGGGVLDGGMAPQLNVVKTTTKPQSAEEVVAKANAVLAKQAKTDEAVRADRQSLEGVERKLLTEATAAGLGDSIKFRQEERGLVVTILADEVLFDLGSADLRGEGQRVLGSLADALARVPNQIAVEGHTDDLPITGRYASNWELSTARATNVLRFLISTHRLPAKRLTASGYADQRPVAANDSPAHRAGNRRVEIVVLSEITDS